MVPPLCFPTTTACCLWKNKTSVGSDPHKVAQYRKLVLFSSGPPSLWPPHFFLVKEVKKVKIQPLARKFRCPLVVVFLIIGVLVEAVKKREVGILAAPESLLQMKRSIRRTHRSILVSSESNTYYFKVSHPKHV